jgi:hypothetical protein
MVFNIAFDAARFCIVNDRIRSENAPIVFPIAIIHGITVADQQILDFKAVRNFLLVQHGLIFVFVFIGVCFAAFRKK